jgi:phosphoribosyl 1,2-cyclic phosphate phosphodiesterase
VKVRILGCGTSTGVPKIGNNWGQCDPDEPRNRRLRSSIVLDSAGDTLLVDCGPDLRQQMLEGGIGRIDGLIVTHDHADHCHGIDDLRKLYHARRRPVQGYARPYTLELLKQRFGYAFEGGKPS